MLNPAVAAPEMREQIRAHHCPTQARPPAHSGVGIGDVHHTLLNEVDNLPINRCLQAVRDMSVDFFLDGNRVFSYLGVKRALLSHSFSFCFPARNDLVHLTPTKGAWMNCPDATPLY